MSNIPNYLSLATEDYNFYIINIFSSTQLTKIKKKDLSRFCLPSESNSFLCNTGLPESDEILMDNLQVTFNLLKPPLLTLEEFAKKANLPPAPQHLSKCVCIDFSDFQDLTCIDVLRGGSIYKIDPNRGYCEKFVNSQVEKFGIFAAVYVAHIKHTEYLKWQELSFADVHLYECMQTIDPQAFADPDNWWAVILEEMLSGLR